MIYLLSNAPIIIDSTRSMIMLAMLFILGISTYLVCVSLQEPEDGKTDQTKEKS